MAPGKYAADMGVQHTLSPIVTGATVIGMKYKDGVIMAADTLASYGSQARYKDICRLKTVGKYTLLGASGELSDFQYMSNMLDDLDNEEFCHEDDCSMGPKEYASYIGRVMYNRRSKMNPLYNQFVICGKKKDGSAHLSFVDHQGTSFEEDYVATGFGAHLATPLIRNEWKPDMTLQEATDLITKCLKVCFYRDCRAYCKIQIATCDGTTSKIQPAITLDHYWGHSVWNRKTLENAGGGTADTW